MAHVHFDVKRDGGTKVVYTARLYTGTRGMENPEELDPVVVLGGPTWISVEELLRLWAPILHDHGYVVTRSVCGLPSSMITATW